jgi:hypothetical protein
MVSQIIGLPWLPFVAAGSRRVNEQHVVSAVESRASTHFYSRDIIPEGIDPDVLAGGRARYEFESCGSGLCAHKVPSVLDRSCRIVRFQVGAIHGVFHSLTPRPHGADWDLAIGDSDRPASLLEKSPVPASRLQTPRSHENTVIHHDNPDADEAVRPVTGSDA